MKLFKYIPFIICLFSSSGCTMTKAPCPNHFVQQSSLKFLSKTVQAVGMWEEYKMIANTKSTEAEPDFATFGRVGDWDIVGLSVSQINEYVNWRTAQVNRDKTRWPPVCGSRYWKQMHKFDKHNQFRINFYIPKFSEVTQIEVDAPAIYFADTIIRKPYRSYDTTKYAFYLAAEYIKK
jgi:hypothetical protein